MKENGWMDIDAYFGPAPSLLPSVSPPRSSASGSPTAGPSCDARPGPAGPPTQLPAPCFPPGTQAVPLGPPDSYRKEVEEGEEESDDDHQVLHRWHSTSFIQSQLLSLSKK